MLLKVNIRILDKGPGSLIKEGDKDYEVFKSWSDRKDTKNGVLVCVPHVEEPVEPEGDVVPEPPAGDIVDGEVIDPAVEPDAGPEEPKTVEVPVEASKNKKKGK